MSQEIAEVKKIIRQILLKEEKDPNKPGDWGLVPEYTKSGIKYTFTGVTPGTRTNPTKVKYSKTDSSNKSMGIEEISWLDLPNEAFMGGKRPSGAALPVPAAPPPAATPAPASGGGAAGTASAPAKPAAPAARPAAAAQGYAKLNTVLRDISTQLSTRIERNFKFGGKVYSPSAIPTVTSSDELSVSTVAYLYTAGYQLQQKINADKNKWTQKVLSFFGRGTGSRIEDIYNDTKWKEMLDSLALNNPAPVKDAARAYLEALPPGNLGFDRKTIDGFADYLVKLATALDVLAPGASSVAPGGVASGGEGAPAATPDRLTEFLSTDAILELTDKTGDKQKISSGFGRPAAEALDALKDRLLRVDSVAFETIKGSVNDELNTSLSTLPANAANLEAVISAWTPPTELLRFEKTEQGLVSFLKAAYITKRNESLDPTGQTAISSIGLPLLLDSNGLFPASEPWISLGFNGSIGAMPMFMLLVPGSAPAESELKLTFGGTTYRIPRASPSKPGIPTFYAIGNEPMQYGNFRVNPNFTGEDGAKFSDAIRRSMPIDIEISYDGKTWRKPSTVIRLGDRIELTESDRVKSPQEQAQRLSGEETSRQIEATLLGVSVGGPSKRGAFELQNVYIDNSGKIDIRRPKVEIQKRVRGSGDQFTLTSVDLNNDYILIPVPISAAADAMSPKADAGSSHWTSFVLGGKVPQAGSAIGGVKVKYLPVTMMSWGYNENYLSFGKDGVGQINPALVDYVVAPSEAVKGLNLDVLTEEEALTQGAAGVSDPIKTAIIRYVQSSDNPAGTALYLSSNLYARMNGYDRYVARSF